ncbi:hypothetical protein ACHAXA_002793 [Cyclostephanos tholiformis]|uniref:Glycosyltransferase n=1 Tax=Cyclostephanos tholiformis TaxID=382380 RepID=A0ABD3RSZ5_9STRA
MMSLSAALLVVLSASSIAVDAKSIPKSIIQTSRDSTVDRPDWIEYRNSLQKFNPEFELVHYSDEEARAFIAENYAGTILMDTYDIVTPIMRADLFRLAAIYKLGGFYMDMDMLGKSSLAPLVESIDNEEFQAVFPKEWWMSTGYYSNIYPGRTPEDDEDHWQVGQYAFGAVPEHPFIKDALEEAIVRSVNLMTTKGDDPDSIRDVDILAATGPYLFTELYHSGRKEGRYADVYHLAGDSNAPVLENRHGGQDWHKFGPYCEHMLSHTWTKPVTETERRMQEVNATNTTEVNPAEAERSPAAYSSVSLVVSAVVGLAGLLGFAFL